MPELPPLKLPDAQALLFFHGLALHWGDALDQRDEVKRIAGAQDIGRVVLKTAMRATVISADQQLGSRLPCLAELLYPLCQVLQLQRSLGQLLLTVSILVLLLLQHHGQ